MCTIDALWYGNITPQEQIGKNNTQIKTLLALIVRNKENLDEALGEEQKVVLTTLTDSYDKYAFLLEKEAFREGFCLATKLFAEAVVKE